MLYKILVSPPFGEWIKFLPETSNVVGSLTVPRRRGRYCQAIKTIRPICGKNSWRNKIGLRTKGVDLFEYRARQNEVLSIAAINYEDWFVFCEMFDRHKNYGFKQLEINVGCPNTLTQPLLAKDVKMFLERFDEVIVKVPPKESSFEVILGLKREGVKLFHLFNTYPSRLGGVSGEFLKKVNVRLIKKFECRNDYERVEWVAGGGIYCLDDVKMYCDLGAKYFSLSTVFYNPLKGMGLVREMREYFKQNKL